MDDEEARRVKENLFLQLETFPKEQKDSLKEQISAMSPAELENFLAQQKGAGSHGGECLFCQIASGKIDTIKIYEDANVFAILDINPISPGHAIVMPKQHFQFLFQLSEPLMLNVMKVVNLLSEIIVNVTKAKGININMAMGEIAGQRVPHIAINLVPRHDKDNIFFDAERKKIDKKELEKIGRDISAHVGRMQAEHRAKMSKAEEATKEKQEKKEKTEAEKMLKFVKRRMP